MKNLSLTEMPGRQLPRESPKYLPTDIIAGGVGKPPQKNSDFIDDGVTSRGPTFYVKLVTDIIEYGERRHREKTY